MEFQVAQHLLDTQLTTNPIIKLTVTFLLHQLLPKATVVAQAQSEYNSENINEQISTVNTLYPQIDPNVLKESDAPPCEHKKNIISTTNSQ